MNVLGLISRVCISLHTRISQYSILNISKGEIKEIAELRSQKGMSCVEEFLESKTKEQMTSQPLFICFN